MQCTYSYTYMHHIYIYICICIYIYIHNMMYISIFVYNPKSIGCGIGACGVICQSVCLYTYRLHVWVCVCMCRSVYSSWPLYHCHCDWLPMYLSLSLPVLLHVLFLPCDRFFLFVFGLKNRTSFLLSINTTLPTRPK